MSRHLKNTRELYFSWELPRIATLTLQWERDDNGTLLVTCKELPEVTTFAETEKDVEDIGAKAIGEAIQARKANGEPLP